MNRKVIKIVSILLMALMVVTMLATSVSATEVTGDTSTSVNQFIVKDSSGAASSIQNFIGAIITIVQVIGIGVAIIMLIVLAIKYISAAPSEKAEIKKTVTIYVVGAIVLFAASGILQIIKNFAGNVKAVETTDTTSCVEVVDMDEMYLG